MARISIGFKVGVGVGVIVGERVGDGVALGVELEVGVAVRVGAGFVLGCTVAGGASTAGLRAEQAVNTGKAQEKTIKSPTAYRGIFIGIHM